MVKLRSTLAAKFGVIRIIRAALGSKNSERRRNQRKGGQDNAQKYQWLGFHCFSLLFR
jgi:hypothetical protein